MGPNFKSNLRSDKSNEEEEKEMNLCADGCTKAKLFSVLMDRKIQGEQVHISISHFHL